MLFRCLLFISHFFTIFYVTRYLFTPSCSHTWKPACPFLLFLIFNVLFYKFIYFVSILSTTATILNCRFYTFLNLICSRHLCSSRRLHQLFEKLWGALALFSRRRSHLELFIHDLIVIFMGMLLEFFFLVAFLDLFGDINIFGIL